MDFEDINIQEIQTEPLKQTRFRRSISGLIKKEIMRRIYNASSVFPIKVKMTETSIRYYYFMQRTAQDRRLPVSATQRAIINSAKLIHKKEIARIKKAFKTIENNTNDTVPNAKEVPVPKIANFIKLMWLNEEFFISKEKIRNYVYGFSVIYSGCKPLLKRKK